jgi:hypothetical protein
MAHSQHIWAARNPTGFFMAPPKHRKRPEGYAKRELEIGEIIINPIEKINLWGKIKQWRMKWTEISLNFWRDITKEQINRWIV